MENIYRVKYATLDYEPATETDIYGEIQEEIVDELGLTRIEMQCEDGLTIILEKEILQSQSLPKRIRTIEYVDEKGQIVGTETEKRKSKKEE